MMEHWGRWLRFGPSRSQLAGVLGVIQVVRLSIQKSQLLAGLNVLEYGAIWPGRHFIPGWDYVEQPEMASIKKAWIFTIARGVKHDFPEVTLRHGSTRKVRGK